MSTPGSVGDHGEAIPGPPWILGHRGTPGEAPENTLAGMRRAVEIGLDGFEYDMRACATGEAVLIHDARLDRTTDAEGPIAERSLPELFGIDAGGWFHRKFRGEPLALFEEALEVGGDLEQGPPMHMIELKERGLVRGVAQRLRELPRPLSVRVASFLRDVVLEARDSDLPTMLIAVHATEDDRRFVRDERITAYGTGPSGWRTEAGAADWSFCERWAWSVDRPDDLVDACRMPLFAFNTNEPYRALATRALVRLTPDDDGAYPVQTSVLEVDPETLSEEERARGEWFGAWQTSAGVRNPFPFRVDVACDAFVKNGAFEFDGLPSRFSLEPGEELRVPFRVVGGSRSPGNDPLFAALFRWREGPGRPLGRLLFDAPLHRVRSVVADPIARRLTLLPEHAGDPPASMTIMRQARQLLVSIENPGDIEDPHTVVHFDGEIVRGGPGVRIRLPEDFDTVEAGVAFSCGIEGRRRGLPATRRWAGGIPEGLGHGIPGVLTPLIGA